MDTSRISPIFISHGSPMTALEPREAGAFMQRLGPAIEAAFGRPRASLAVSAHTLTRAPVLLAAARHEAVYDFGGFPDALYRLRYDAPGAPALADAVQARLQAAGIEAHRVEQGGLDHGIWTPLRYMWPQADLPVLPLAYVPSWSPRQLFDFGAALAPLAGQGVLIMASGSITHNLRRASPAAVPAMPARRRWPRALPSEAGSCSAARSVTGTRCSTTAVPHRMRPTCTRATNTCCPGTWRPVPAAAMPLRCACTTA